jgi:hypothetical protein
MAPPAFMVVFGADRAQITTAEVNREDWSRFFVAALCAGRSFWQLLADGRLLPVSRTAWKITPSLKPTRGAASAAALTR